MRVALVITAKNERDLLRANLLYHRYIGVDEAFIFDDGATDGTPETVRDLPFAQVAPSVAPDGFRDRPELKEFVERTHEHHMARINLNCCAALERAREQGADWLLYLDADELVCIDRQDAGPGQLKAFLAQVPDGVATVRFPTYEVVQGRLEYDNVFVQETLFKRRDVPIRRWVYDPFARRRCRVNGFFGQSKGKSAVRLSVRARPKDAHKFVALDGTDLPSLWAGHLLHYYLYSFTDFVKKNRNVRGEPNTWLGGSPVEYQKQLWRRIVNQSDFTQEQMRDYYQRWIQFHDEEIRRLRSERAWGLFRREPALVEVTAVRSVFERLLDGELS